jgi:hypothetical protein
LAVVTPLIPIPNVLSVNGVSKVEPNFVNSLSYFEAIFATIPMLTQEIHL